MMQSIQLSAQSKAHGRSFTLKTRGNALQKRVVNCGGSGHVGSIHRSQSSLRSTFAPALAWSSQPLKMRSRTCRATTSPTTAMAATSKSKVWTVQIYSHTPYDVDSKVNVSIQLVSGESGARSDVASINKWQVDPWITPEQLLNGRMRSGIITVPADFGKPGAILVTKSSGAGNGSLIDTVQLKSGVEELIIPCHSWIWANNKPRVFFHGATLPKDTPAALKALREDDLAEIKGKTEAERKAKREEGDRILDFDVYDDLTVFDGKDGKRPPLGGPSIPFPRRLRTGRLKKDGAETLPPKKAGILPGDLWLSPDEKFTQTKDHAFYGSAIVAIIPAVIPIIQGLFKGRKQYDSFADALSTLDNESVKGGISSLLPRELPFLKPGDIGKQRQAPALTEEQMQAVETAVDAVVSSAASQAVFLDPPAAEAGKFLQLVDKFAQFKMSTLKSLKFLLQGFDDADDLFEFPVPRVLKDRADAWHKDEEFGRQVFAGVNPIAVTVAKGIPAGSAITADHVKGLIQEDLTTLFGQSGTKPRLFWVDYVAGFEDYLEVVNSLKGPSVMNAARVLLYKRADGNIVPVAIETKTKKSDPFTVYTPKDAPQVWLLAKCVIGSLDAAFHQGYSHFLKCHGASEPYMIALGRNLSTLHPVYQLMKPHFRYTLNINMGARQNLINAGGIVERTLAPLKYSLELTGKVYGLMWRFNTEGLPADLKNRGFMDDNGKLLVDDYPYAEDGMAIWNTYVGFFAEYLTLYYKSDEDVLADPELQAWWNEVQTKGHPDIKDGWPVLNKLPGPGEPSLLSTLVNIFATIAWIASGHHAAVNFVQYDYNSTLLNKPNLIQKPLPAQGTAEYKALASSTGTQFEKLYLSYLTPPTQATLVTLVVKFLSLHSIDEQYLSAETHEYLKTGAPLKAFNRFVASIKNAEVDIAERNHDPTRRTRNPEAGGMQYDVLLPSSPQSGMTSRGVPYSVSI